MPVSRWLLVLAAAALLTADAAADEPIRLEEKFAPGYRYRVSFRHTGSGTVPVPVKKDGPGAKSLELTGKSTLDYDERVLEADAANGVVKTVRVYSKAELARTMDKDEMTLTVRPAARRMVVQREKALRAPFSPDGPLTLAEIEFVRTEVFTPDLVAGLLPNRLVKPGDTWKAGEAAVLTLTELEKIEEGALECRFDEVTTHLGRRVARVAVTGSVRGVGEDGPVRHTLDGRFFFDLQSNHLWDLSLQGRQAFLDENGKEAGRIDGTATLTRLVNVAMPDVDDAALRGVNLNRTAENTLLLYDNPDIGVRFVHPRAWKVKEVTNRQVMVDGPDGNGLVLTPALARDVPTPAQFEAEARAQLTERLQGKVYGSLPPKELQADPPVVRFTMEAELGGKRVLMDYYIVRGKDAGATIAARLLPEEVRERRPEVERIARSLVVGK